jgi:hypothetical protein
MITVPKLEDASAEFARLMARHHELMARGAEIDSSIRALHVAMGTEQAADRHTDRVSALLSGVDYRPPAPIKDQIAELTAERRAIDTAIRELAGSIALERDRASRDVVAKFEDQRLAMATEFFTHIAAAAKVHAQFGDMRRAFHRAEVSPASFIDFGAELFGDPGHRNGDVGIALRLAARKGYLPDAQIPEAFR